MAQATEIVNKFGTMTGWNSLSTNMMFRDIEAYTKISYDDTVEKENWYGKGKMPQGRTEKNYKAGCKIQLAKEEMDLLKRSLPRGTRIQEIAPFNITCSYERKDGTVTTDVINNCEFTDQAVEVQQGDGSIEYEYTLIISHIDWDV